MRILVIDNLLENLAAAENQLQGHELVIVSSYDEAQKALTPQLNWDAYERRTDELTTEAGFPGTHKNYLKAEVGEEKWAAYWSANRKAGDQAVAELTVHPRFDAVLTDLMMPPSKQALAEPHKFAGQEMPLGTFLVLLALRAGIKKVGLVTDTNHHHHPASAALDAFSSRREGAFDVGGTKVVCWNNGKSWAAVLKLLNGEKLK